MAVPYRPLGHIREMVNALGLEVTYIYEDLVYVEHNAFLLQMGERGEMISLYFNAESDPAERDGISGQLEKAGQARELSVNRKGTFTMSQLPDEERIEITFLDGKM